MDQRKEAGAILDAPAMALLGQHIQRGDLEAEQLLGGRGLETSVSGRKEMPHGTRKTSTVISKNFKNGNEKVLEFTLHHSRRLN